MLVGCASIMHQVTADESTNVTSTFNSRPTPPSVNLTNASLPTTVLNTTESTVTANELERSTSGQQYSEAKSEESVSKLVTLRPTSPTTISHSTIKDHPSLLDEKDQKLEEVMNTVVSSASEFAEGREGSGDEVIDGENATITFASRKFSDTSGPDITTPADTETSSSHFNQSLFETAHVLTTTQFSSSTSTNFNHTSAPITLQTKSVTTTSTKNGGNYTQSLDTEIPPITTLTTIALPENVSTATSLQTTTVDEKLSTVLENVPTVLANTVSDLAIVENALMSTTKSQENLTNITHGDGENGTTGVTNAVSHTVAVTVSTDPSTLLNFTANPEEQITESKLSITELSIQPLSETHGTQATTAVSKESTQSYISTVSKSQTPEDFQQVNSTKENYITVNSTSKTITDQITAATFTEPQPPSTMVKCYDDLTDVEFLNSITLTFKISQNEEINEQRFKYTILCLINLYESQQWPSFIQNVSECDKNDSELYKEEKPSSLNPLSSANLVIIQPSPKVIGDDEIILAFFTRNSSIQGKIVSRNKTIGVLHNHQNFIENQIGMNITQIYGGLKISPLVSPTIEPFYTRHYLLLITIILVASVCILIIIIGLLYIKCRTTKQRWSSNNSFNHEKAQLQKDVCAEMGEHLNSDDDIHKDETLRAINNGNGFFGTDTGSGSSAIPIGDEDGWVIPYDELSPEEKSTVEIEDTKL